MASKVSVNAVTAITKVDTMLKAATATISSRIINITRGSRPAGVACPWEVMTTTLSPAAGDAACPCHACPYHLR